MKRSAFLALLILVFLRPSAGFASSEEKLVGTWNLIGYEQVDGKGGWIPRCHSPHGLITYTAEGVMAVGINCLRAGSSTETSTAPDEMVFYTGRYSLRGDQVIHHVANASNTAWIGKDLERQVIFQGDELVLTGKGYKNSVRVRWKKITGDSK